MLCGRYNAIEGRTHLIEVETGGQTPLSSDRVVDEPPPGQPIICARIECVKPVLGCCQVVIDLHHSAEQYLLPYIQDSVPRRRWLLQTSKLSVVHHLGFDEERAYN